MLQRKLISQFDWGLFLLTLMVPLTGLVVLYSAGYDPDLEVQPVNWLPIVIKSQVFLKQFIFLGAVLVLPPGR